MAGFLTYLAADPPPDLLVIHGTRINPATGKLQSHTFTVDRHWYFDNNTPDGPVPLQEVSERVPEEILTMRIVDVVIVRCPE